MTRYISHVGRKACRRAVVHEAANAATPEAQLSRLRDNREGLSDCGREGRRGSADQGRELAAVVEQRPVRRVGIPTGDGLCDRLGETESHKRRRIFVHWQILVGDGPACLPRTLGGEVRKRIGVVASELIRFAVMTCPDERSDGGLRVVDPCRARKLPGPRASYDSAARERATDRGGMVL